MSLLPNCREVTRLLLEAEEHALPWPDRARIRLHLGICDACSTFSRQVDFMRQALGHWRREDDNSPTAPGNHPANPPEA